MRSRQLLLLLIGIVLVAGGVIVYRTRNQSHVSAADLLTPIDVQLIQNDLNAGNPQWQVRIEVNDPYVADASRFGTGPATIRCSTRTYFDHEVNHATVRAVTPLRFSGSRELNCWTFAARSPAAAAS